MPDAAPAAAPVAVAPPDQERLMRHAGSSLNSRIYTDAGLLDLREPMRLLDERDRAERRAWRRGIGRRTLGSPGG